jgi:hypothetical protein
MPRFGSTSRTSIVEAETYYDLNKDFTSYTGEYPYSKSANLIFWGNLCSPKAVSAEYASVVGSQLIGSDNSLSTTKYGLYSPSTMAMTHISTEDFCGDKCRFQYSGFTFAQSSPDSGIASISGHYFFIPDHDGLTFNAAGNDKPFSISLWYQSLDPNAGGTVSGNPISYLINKPYEYGVSVTGDSKLRFSLSTATAGSGSIYVESSASPMSDSVLDGSGVMQGWNNVIVTYDGSESPNGMRIFVNGNSVEASTTTSGSYTGMVNMNGSLFFGSGAGIAGSSLPLGTATFGFASIAEPAIWDAELSEKDVLAVYNATLTCVLKNSELEIFKGESGYTTPPPRVWMRDFDNHPNSYPSVLRTGDRDRKGNYNVSFDDTSTIFFGEKISDDFSNIVLATQSSFGEIFSKRIDKTKWEFSSGLVIRQESLSGENGESFKNGALVFAGTGPRYIKTKRKVRSPTIRFSVIQGPHNQGLLGLNLGTPQRGLAEKLIVKISTDGLSWTSVREINPTLDLVEFYVGGNGIAFSELERERFASESDENKFRKIIEINFSEIQDPGSDYYVKIEQETVEDENNAVWAIGDIEIDSINQNVRYPLLVDHGTTAGKRVEESFIVTPHTRSDISAISRSVSGITDTMLKFTPAEDISPFNDAAHFVNTDSTNLFHSVGTESELMPGFTSRLADKTKFSIDLTTYNSPYLGYTSNIIGNAGVPLGVGGRRYPLMGYYNHSLKKWEAIAKGYEDTNHQIWFHGTDYPGYNGKSKAMYSLTSSAVGFGPYGHVADEAGSSLGSSVLSRYSQKISNFAFPFSGRYHATGSQVINATSIGITKPFLLEKMVLEFDGMFEYADHVALTGDNDTEDRAFMFKIASRSMLLRTDQGGNPQTLSNYAYDTSYKYYLPTFFLMRQHTGGIDETSIDCEFNITGTIHGPLPDPYSNGLYRSLLHITGSSPWARYEERVPNYFNLNGDGSTLRRVTTTRDLAAYGQLGILVSGSTVSGENGLIDIDTVLADGMEREGIVRITPDATCAITSSFRVEMRASTCQRYEASTAVTVIDQIISAADIYTGSLYLSNDVRVGIETSRKFINSTPGYQSPSGEATTFDLLPQAVADGTGGTGAGGKTIKLSNEQMKLPSPYLILPGDELIIGAQYPMSDDSVRMNTTTAGNKRKNQMKFHGPAKLHLFGSLISDNKEYHEYNNQNLTSNALHEIIGGEKILDQFQVATRTELSGSYLDDWIATKVEWKRNTGGTTNLYAYPYESAHYAPPLERIGLRSISIVRANARWESNQSNFANWPGDPRGSDFNLAERGRSRDVYNLIKEKRSIQRFVKSHDNSRIFYDSKFMSGTFYSAQSAMSSVEKERMPLGTYGTMQTALPGHQIKSEPVPYEGPDGNMTGSYRTSRMISRGSQPHYSCSDDRPWIRRKMHNRAKPSYYFNYQHFGYCSDMLEQARDSKFYTSYMSTQLNPTQLANIPIKFSPLTGTLSKPQGRKSSIQDETAFFPMDIAPPILTQFASGSSLSTSKLVVYKKIIGSAEIVAKIGTLSGPNPIFNTSLHYTSSFPFIEDSRNSLSSLTS